MAEKNKKTGLPKKVVAATLSIQLLTSAAMPLWATPVDQFSTPAVSASITQEKEAETFVENGITYKVTAEDTVQVGDGINAMKEVSGKVIIPQTIQHEGHIYNVTGIGNKAFFTNTKLTEIDIPDGVVTIGDMAFNGTGLKSVKLPNTVKSLGVSVFTRCADLTEVSLSPNLSTISESAFASTGIKTLVIPEGVTSIDKDAFNSCASLTSVELPKSLTTIGESAFWSNAALKTVTIADGSKLESVGESAFRFNEAMKSINLPKGLKVIGKSAFSHCKLLADIGLDQNSQLTKLGTDAFSSTKISEFYMPATLKTIGENPFDGCLSLKAINVAADNTERKSVDGILFSKDGKTLIQYPANKTGASYTVPQGVTKIGERAFLGSKKLGELTISEGVTNIGASAFESMGMLNTLNLADSIETIDRVAIYKCPSLEEVTLPKNLKKMVGYTISNCDSLGKVTFGSNLTEIETMAFSGCRSLSEIVIPSIKLSTVENRAFGDVPDASITVANNAVKDTIVASGVSEDKITVDETLAPKPVDAEFVVDGITYKTTSEDTVQVGDGVTSMSNLSGSITIPSTVKHNDITYNVTAIGDRAFTDAYSLKEVKFAQDSQITVIGESAFDSTSIKKIVLPNSVKNLGTKAFNMCKSLENVTLNDGLLTIGDGAFQYCNFLMNIKIPASVTSIGKTVFDGSPYLKSIEVAPENKVYSSQDGILFDKSKSKLITSPINKQFSDEYTVPTSVRTIGENAFSESKYLTNIKLPDKLVTIEPKAFNKAKSLETIDLGSSLTSIGKMAFYQCENLGEITIPASVNTIEGYAFDRCSSATYIVPTEEMKGKLVKAGAEESSIQVVEAKIEVGSIIKYNDIEYKVLNLPTETQNGTVALGDGIKKIHASGVVTIPATIEAGNSKFDVAKVSKGALGGTDVTELKLPETVTAIDESALQNAKELTKFTIPSGVESIGMNAIADCDKLQSIDYAPNSSLTTIENGAFCGNKILETIALPNTLQNIGTHTMYWNNVLREVTFQEGSTWTELPEGTFMKDYKLEQVNNLPEGLTSIGKEAFHNCESLKNIDLSQITSIGEGAFTNCKTLEEITINDEVEALEAGTFKDCSGLQSVKLGSGLTRLGTIESEGEDEATGVFQNCTGLTEITVPEKVSYFGIGTFQGCTKLAKIELLSDSIDTMVPTVFYDIPSDATIYVVNKQMKDFVSKEAVVGKDSIKVIGGETPEPTPGEGGDEGGTTPTPGGGSVTPIPPVVPEEPDTDVKPETEVKPDGTKVETKTEEDGTIIETSTKPNGDVTEVVSKPDGSATTIETRKDGTKVETQTTAQGKTTAEIAVPEDQKNVVVTIPKEDLKPNQVAVITKADGSKEVIKKSVASEDGLKLMVDENVKVEIVDNSKTFNDTDNHWANDAIDFVTSREIFNGMGEETFAPEAAMTRGMLVQVLYNFENQPEGSKAVDFGDVSSDAWFADAVAWAADNEIVAGVGEGNFAPNDNISREQLVTILYRYAGEPKPAGSLDKYSDAMNVSDYAQDAMLWAVENGIVSGMGNNTLAPQGQATRAQVAQIMMNFCDFII